MCSPFTHIWLSGKELWIIDVHCGFPTIIISLSEVYTSDSCTSPECILKKTLLVSRLCEGGEKDGFKMASKQFCYFYFNCFKMVAKQLHYLNNCLRWFKWGKQNVYKANYNFYLKCFGVGLFFFFFTTIIKHYSLNSHLNDFSCTYITISEMWVSLNLTFSIHFSV